MIGILIVTHGTFAAGLQSAVELIAGKQKNMESIGVFHGDSIEHVKSQVAEAIGRLSHDDGVLVFVDIIGGTPSNVVLKHMENDRVRAVSNVNLPMVVNAVFAREQSTLAELCEQSVEVGGKPPILLHQLYSEIIGRQEDEDF